MRSRRHRSIAVLLCLPLASAGMTWALLGGIGRPTTTVVRQPVQQVVTEPVRQRVLRSAVVTRGDVVEVGAVGVTLSGDVAGVEGEPVYTRRVAGRGTLIASGDVLTEVSGRPVIAMEGEVPMYRSLRPGLRGHDVFQLESQLGRQGYLREEPDETFDAATTAAVRELYAGLGYEPALPPEGEAPPTDGTEPAAATMPRGELVFLPGLPRSVSGSNVVVGEVPSDVAFTLAGRGTHVRATVSLSQAASITVGARVRLFGPDSAVTLPGQVTRVLSRGGVTGEAQIWIQSRRSLRQWVGQSLGVRIVVKSSRKPVLAVSPAALYTTEDGKVSVDVLLPGSARTHRVEVALGLEADALVEIRPMGAGLRAGDRVVVAAS